MHTEGKENISQERFSKEFLKDLKKINQRIERIERKEMVSENEEKILKKEIKKYIEEYQTTFEPSPKSSLGKTRQMLSQLTFPEQISALVEMVFRQGLKKAIQVAKSLNNPALLDEFHDILVDRFYYLLKEKGLIKKK